MYNYDTPFINKIIHLVLLPPIFFGGVVKVMYFTQIYTWFLFGEPTFGHLPSSWRSKTRSATWSSWTQRLPEGIKESRVVYMKPVIPITCAANIDFLHKAERILSGMSMEVSH